MNRLKLFFQDPERNKIILPVHLFFFFVFLLIICTKTESVKPWLIFPDNYDYLEQSKHDYLSKDLYSPERGARLARAFTVPLIYKITGSDFFTFMSFQTAFYCICVFLFLLSLLPWIKNFYLKLLFIPLLYFVFSWWNIVGWTTLGVSEHISFCFLLLWLGSMLYFLSKRTIASFILHLLVAILLSFSRDTFAYLILLTPVLLALFYFKKERRLVLRYFSAYLVCAIILFAMQQKTINTGERYRLSVYNNILVRLARNPEYMAWFKEKGLPLTEKIQAEFGKFDPDNREDVNRLYGTYYSPEYAPVFDWIVTKGKSAYTQFLLTHPGYLLLMDQTDRERYRIFCYNLTVYTGNPQGYYVLPDAVLPFLSPWVVIASCIVVLLMFLKNRESFVDSRLMFPLFLLLFATANVFLSYNAEAMEVERHMYYTTILLEIIGWINLFTIADRVIDLVQKRRAAAR